MVKQSIPTMLLRLYHALLRHGYDLTWPRYHMQADSHRWHPNPLRSPTVLSRLCLDSNMTHHEYVWFTQTVLWFVTFIVGSTRIHYRTLAQFVTTGHSLIYNTVPCRRALALRTVYLFSGLRGSTLDSTLSSGSFPQRHIDDVGWCKQLGSEQHNDTFIKSAVTSCVVEMVHSKVVVNFSGVRVSRSGSGVVRVYRSRWQQNQSAS